MCWNSEAGCQVTFREPNLRNVQLTADGELTAALDGMPDVTYESSTIDGLYDGDQNVTVELADGTECAGVSDAVSGCSAKQFYDNRYDVSELFARAGGDDTVAIRIAEGCSFPCPADTMAESVVINGDVVVGGFASNIVRVTVD